MLALFNLGLPELIILALFGLTLLGVVAAVVLVVVYSTRGQGRKDPDED